VSLKRWMALTRQNALPYYIVWLSNHHYQRKHPEYGVNVTAEQLREWASMYGDVDKLPDSTKALLHAVLR